MRFKHLFIALALMLASAPAFAQFNDMSGVPHTTVVDQVNDQSVKIFVGAINTPFEPTVGLFEPDGTGHYKTFWSSSISIDWPPNPVSPTQANAFLVAMLPQLNGAIANRFSISTSPPPPCGDLRCDAINTQLYTTFIFQVTPDGATVLTTH